MASSSPPYRLHQRIGRGGTCVVDLATDPQGRLVAVKRLVLPAGWREAEVARARIHREAIALQRLRHPHVVPLYDLLEEDGSLVLVLPWLGGGDLASRVAAAGPMPPLVVLELGAALFSGLAAAHAAGIVHRDVKPANVLFDAAGTPFLADFGIASFRDLTGGLTAAGALVGTPEYMAPEQARAAPTGGAADVFALAATLRFAATGIPPYGHGDRAVTLHRAARHQLAPTPSVSDPAATQVLRLLRPMLRADPRRRPTAAQAGHRFSLAAARTARGSRPSRPVPAAVPNPRLAPGAPAPGVAAAPGPRQPPCPPDPVPRPPAPAAPAAPGARRRRLALAAVAAVAATLVVVLAAGVTSALRGRPDAPAAGPVSPTAVAPTPSTVACRDLPYRPCGKPTAPFTDGESCIDRHADYDGVAANGCEAAPDDRDGETLAPAVTANLVPADDVDRYPLPVADNFQFLCDGTVEVALAAPAGAPLRMEVLRDGRRLSAADVAPGTTGRVRLQDPNCGEDDRTTLSVQVRGAGPSRTAANYELSATGSY